MGLLKPNSIFYCKYAENLDFDGENLTMLWTLLVPIAVAGNHWHGSTKRKRIECPIKSGSFWRKLFELCIWFLCVTKPVFVTKSSFKSLHLGGINIAGAKPVKQFTHYGGGIQGGGWNWWKTFLGFLICLINFKFS